MRKSLIVDKQSMLLFVVRLTTVLSCVLFLKSCSDMLDTKPSTALAVPSTMEDFEAMMNNTAVVNHSESVLQEIGTGDYYLTDAVYNALSRIEDRTNYLWQRTPAITGHWSSSYKAIFICNMTLDHIDKLTAQFGPQERIGRLQGKALFHRGRLQYRLLHVFAKGYDPQTAATDLGIVLRKNANVDEPSIRYSIATCLEHTLDDLKKSIHLLPDQSINKTDPDKASAWALLSDIYLHIDDYDRAYLYADSAIRYGNAELLDYRSISTTSTAPFSQLNKELIYHASANGGTPMSSSRARVHLDLYDLYEANDLRKTRFFAPRDVVHWVFKGNYEGGLASSALFSGSTLAEAMLIQAEAAVRTDRVSEGIRILNLLRQKRYEPYTALEEAEADEALKAVLLERRKELVFRGRHWGDIRRLIRKNEWQGNLQRTVNGTVYTYSADQIKNHAYLIPQDVIDNSSLAQN